MVLGLEGDISAVGDDDDDDDDDFEFEVFDEVIGATEPFDLEDYDGTGRVSFENDLEWLATFRGKVGVAVGTEGRFHGYITGGLAVAGVDRSIDAEFDQVFDTGSDDPECQPDSADDPSLGCFFSGGDDGDDDHELGIAAGIGGDYALTNNVIFGLEYLGYFFDDEETQTITFHGRDGRRFDIHEDTGLDDLHTVRARVTVKLTGWGPGS
jgi:opacity protein-like surface antigen